MKIGSISLVDSENVWFSVVQPPHRKPYPDIFNISPPEMSSPHPPAADGSLINCFVVSRKFAGFFYFLRFHPPALSHQENFPQVNKPLGSNKSYIEKSKWPPGGHHQCGWYALKTSSSSCICFQGFPLRQLPLLGEPKLNGCFQKIGVPPNHPI